RPARRKRAESPAFAGGLARAARNDRPWPDGSEYGAPAFEGRPSMRGARQIPDARRGAGSGESHWHRFAGGTRPEADEAPRRLADDAGRRGGPDHRRPPASPRAGRYPDR